MQLTNGTVKIDWPVIEIEIDGVIWSHPTIDFMRANGWVEVVEEPQQPIPEAVKAEITAAIQAMLDATAQSRGYDSIISMCSYLGSSVAQFAAEAKSGIDYRDSVWMAAGQIQAAFDAGEIEPPEVEAVLVQMPSIIWPIVN